MSIELNHNRPLSDFQPEIDKLKSKGYNPIAVSQMFLEDCFVLETKDEAENAYREFERDVNEKWIGKVVGWWYDKEGFIEAVNDYEKTQNNSVKSIKVLVYWLNRK
jgi:uncharacterized protein (UPF0297 family)